MPKRKRDCYLKSFGNYCQRQTSKHDKEIQKDYKIHKGLFTLTVGTEMGSTGSTDLLRSPGICHEPDTGHTLKFVDKQSRQTFHYLFYGSKMHLGT